MKNNTIYIYDIFLFLLRIRQVSEKRRRTKSKQAFYDQKLFFENRAVYDVIWKNMVETDRPQI